MSVKKNFGLACPNCGKDSGLMVSFTGSCRLLPDGSEDAGDHEWNDDSRCICEACGYESEVKRFHATDDATDDGLTMANIDDDQTEALLAFVKAIARMTLHDDKPYDDTESELAAFDAIIRNARNLINPKDA